MPQIKEIRKLGNEIKEVPKEKKVDSIDDEFDEDAEIDNSGPSFSSRRTNKTSTLEATESRQDTFEDRQARMSNEDKAEVNFRPSYTGGENPYKSNAYTPVGSAESSSKTRDLGERGLGNQRNLDDGMSRNDGGNMERNYAGERDQNRDRKRNLM